MIYQPKLIMCITFLSFIMPSLVSAQWTSVNMVDDFTDEKINYALYSDDEHQLQISYEGSSVWMFITKQGIETFQPNGLIELRVDKKDTRIKDPQQSKELSKFLGGEIFKWEPKTVGFLVWHGKEDEGCGFIGELLEGDFLRFRYQISSMEREAHKIDLEGAKKALINGLNLTICGMQ